MRRDRACRGGPALFVHERAFSDVTERLSEIRRDFSSALLIGAPDPHWPARLGQAAQDVVVVDPSDCFATAAGGTQASEEALDYPPGSFDLCVAMGTLDTVAALPEALLRLRFLLKPDSLLIGVLAGGETLPQLRQAMRAADAEMGAAAPRVHPRIEPAALTHLLSSAGFAMPVVDVDRVKVGYRSLRRLVADLRAMGATNVLSARSRIPLTRAAVRAAEQAFASSAVEGRTVETFELLHFAAWTPAGGAAEHG